MTHLQIDPTDFSPLIESVVETAVRRLQAERPKDADGRILLTKREAAEALGVSEATIDRWRVSHDLPHLKLDNGKPMFRPEALREWAAKREGGAE